MNTNSFNKTNPTKSLHDYKRFNCKQNEWINELFKK